MNTIFNLENERIRVKVISFLLIAGDSLQEIF